MARFSISLRADLEKKEPGYIILHRSDDLSELNDGYTEYETPSVDLRGSHRSPIFSEQEKCHPRRCHIGVDSLGTRYVLIFLSWKGMRRRNGFELSKGSRMLLHGNAFHLGKVGTFSRQGPFFVPPPLSPRIQPVSSFLFPSSLLPKVLNACSHQVGRRGS